MRQKTGSCISERLSVQVFFLFHFFVTGGCFLCLFHRPEADRETHQATTDQPKPGWTKLLVFSPLDPPAWEDLQHFVIVSLNSILVCWFENLTQVDRRSRGSLCWSSKLRLAMPQVRCAKKEINKLQICAVSWQTSLLLNVCKYCLLNRSRWLKQEETLSVLCKNKFWNIQP